MSKRIKTKGNICIDDINIGDTLYEVDIYNHIIYKILVLTLPVRDESGFWQFTGYIKSIEKRVKIGVHEDYPQYSPELYDHIAYEGFDIV